MNHYLLTIVGLIYAYVSLELLIKGNIGMAVAFFAYSISCIGFIIAL